MVQSLEKYSLTAGTQGLTLSKQASGDTQEEGEEVEMAELKDRQQQETEGKPQFHSHLMLIGCVSASLKVLNLKVYM